MSKLLSLFLLAWMPLVPQAADLNLTPSLCAVEKEQGSCNVSIKVAFHADEMSRYCLTILGKGLIRCFWSGEEEELEVFINTERDLTFQITQGESGEQVASATFKVGHYEPKRHRRRYGWGLL